MNYGLGTNSTGLSIVHTIKDIRVKRSSWADFLIHFFKDAIYVFLWLFQLENQKSKKGKKTKEETFQVIKSCLLSEKLCLRADNLRFKTLEN